MPAKEPSHLLQHHLLLLLLLLLLWLRHPPHHLHLLWRQHQFQQHHHHHHHHHLLHIFSFNLQPHQQMFSALKYIRTTSFAYYWKCIFPMSPLVRPIVGWLVGQLVYRLVGWSVCYNFPKGRDDTLQCSCYNHLAVDFMLHKYSFMHLPIITYICIKTSNPLSS